MKLACHSVGVATPAFATAGNDHEAASMLDVLRPPLIVKYPQGYSSVGMTRASRVEDERALAREIDRFATATARRSSRQFGMRSRPEVERTGGLGASWLTGRAPLGTGGGTWV